MRLLLLVWHQLDSHRQLKRTIQLLDVIVAKPREHVIQGIIQHNSPAGPLVELRLAHGGQLDSWSGVMEEHRLMSQGAHDVTCVCDSRRVLIAAPSLVLPDEAQRQLFLCLSQRQWAPPSLSRHR